MHRQLIQGMDEDRSSPELKVVKRNSEVIRDQENVLETRSVAIPTPKRENAPDIVGFIS
jgi:hypothetical protein